MEQVEISRALSWLLKRNKYFFWKINYQDFSPMEIGEDRNTIYVLENWRFGQWSFGQYKKIPPLLEPHRYRILLPLILK